MITVPDDSPVIMPVEEPMDASDGLPQVQKPPGVGSVFVIVLPTHTVAGPDIATGAAITVTVTLVPQPPDEYSIPAVPGDTPVTTPVADPTVATAGPALLHVPPGTGSPSVSAAPTQRLPAPVIAVGTELTVTTAVTRQPVPVIV